MISGPKMEDFGNHYLPEKTGFGLSEGSTIHSEDLMIENAQGVFLWSSQGRRYLDLFSQTWSLPLGHNIKRVNDAVKEQVDRVSHLRTAFSTEKKSELAKRIVGLAPEGLSKLHFVLHASLAVEGAMKLAINHYADRHKILYLEDGFHGRSLATMGISWKMDGCKYGHYFTNGVEVKKDLADIEEKMESERPAGIIIELVQSNSGCRMLDKDLVRGIRMLCDRHGITMIVDEVQTAFGCMGRMFMCEEYGVVPDILVFGKAIGGGYPLAGTIYKDGYHFRSGEHSFTFGSSPISMAAGSAYLDELEAELKKDRVDAISRQIRSSLHDLECGYANLKCARCVGVKGAVDIVDGRGNPDCVAAERIVSKMLEKGVIIATSKCGGVGNAIMLQPPIIITFEQLKYAFDILDSVLSDVFGKPKVLA